MSKKLKNSAILVILCYNITIKLKRIAFPTPLRFLVNVGLRVQVASAPMSIPGEAREPLQCLGR